MISILAFLAILGLLVFAHEAGHFFAAKRAGMAVEEFGFGFPPRLIGARKVKGKWRVVTRNSSDRHSSTSTIYSLNLIPLGGFVRIAGENGADTDDPRNFGAKPRWQRAVVLVAGVAMNIVLAIVFFSTVYAIGAPQVLEGLPSGAVIRDRKTSIVGVLKEGPAVAVGIKPGDTIIAIDGQSFVEVADVQRYIRERGGQEIRVTIDRNGLAQTLLVRPGPLPGVAQPGIGVQLMATGTVRFPPHFALWYGVRTTGNVIADIIRAFGNLIRGLVIDRAVTVDIAGPVGIAVMTGQVVQLGFIHLLQFTAVLSANLALINVFPFPALDGGRLFLLGVEAIRRRSLSKAIENALHAVGFALLFLIVIAVTYRDIVTFGGDIMSSIKSTVGL